MTRSASRFLSGWGYVKVGGAIRRASLRGNPPRPAKFNRGHDLLVTAPSSARAPIRTGSSAEPAVAGAGRARHGEGTSARCRALVTGHADGEDQGFRLR
jgi:hypothetical protein